MLVCNKCLKEIRKGADMVAYNLVGFKDQITLCKECDNTLTTIIKDFLGVK